MTGFAFGSLEELGDGPGFRKVRRALGITAFGVNGVVMPPGFDGFEHCLADLLAGWSGHASRPRRLGPRRCL